MLPDSSMLFKAGKFEVSSNNPILGPLKYIDQENWFSTGKQTSTFVGQCQFGKRFGVGHEIYEDGSGFHGNFINDQKSGRGRIVSAGGDYYHGDFLNGHPDGLGNFLSVSQSFKYEGGFKDGKRHGLGIETRKDGTVYDGDFLDGKWEGKGYLVCPDKSSYKGSFFNNQYQGEGILTK